MGTRTKVAKERQEMKIGAAAFVFNLAFDLTLRPWAADMYFFKVRVWPRSAQGAPICSSIAVSIRDHRALL